MMVIPDRDRARVITPRRPRADDRLRLHKIISDVFVARPIRPPISAIPRRSTFSCRIQRRNSPRRELEFAVIGRAIRYAAAKSCVVPWRC